MGRDSSWGRSATYCMLCTFSCYNSSLLNMSRSQSKTKAAGDIHSFKDCWAFNCYYVACIHSHQMHENSFQAILLRRLPSLQPSLFLQTDVSETAPGLISCFHRRCVCECVFIHLRYLVSAACSYSDLTFNWLSTDWCLTGALMFNLVNFNHLNQKGAAFRRKLGCDRWCLFIKLKWHEEQRKHRCQIKGMLVKQEGLSLR